MEAQPALPVCARMIYPLKILKMFVQKVKRKYDRYRDYHRDPHAIMHGGNGVQIKVAVDTASVTAYSVEQEPRFLN